MSDVKYRVFWRSQLTGHLGNSHGPLTPAVVKAWAEHANREYPDIGHVARPCNYSLSLIEIAHKAMDY